MASSFGREKEDEDGIRDLNVAGACTHHQA